MELLKIKHYDFDMFIECAKFDGIWEKAKRNVGEGNLTSTYTWTAGVVSVERLSSKLPPIASHIALPDVPEIVWCTSVA